ncbi:MAG: starch-binding protein [Clostridia bacterium]|nr:starch-binding protein [Clostridia bacterium]
MKTKRIFAVILSSMICMSLMTACSGSNEGQSTPSDEKSIQSVSSEQSEESKNGETSKESQVSEQSNAKTHTFYIRDAGKNSELKATFLNTTTEKTEEVSMTKVSEGDDYFIYSCEGNVNAYNMVHVTSSDGDTMDVAFNEFVSGWYLNAGELLPYVEGKEPNYKPKYETKVLKFDGYDKNVHIWTPADYDKNSGEKYSVIYMLDGQSVLSTEVAGEIQCWNVAEHVESMMVVTDNKAIIAAIETVGGISEDEKYSGTRDDELIPDLGELADPDFVSNKRGNAFSDFVYNDVVKYVEENYNVYTDAAHNSICGSSFGGLESFYIGMEHPDKFGTIGALSASFWMYSEENWKNYFKTKTFDEKMPFIYFYAGSYAQDTASCDVPTYNWLVENGYPKDKLVFNKDEDGAHFVPFWRNIYPEFLEAMFTQKVSGLESGVPVEYKDKGENSQTRQTEISIDPNDPRTAETMNYIYFDNSETKWEKVYAYWWGNASKNKITGQDMYGAAWPGIEMEKIGDTDIYRIAVPVGPTGFIFDTGVTDDEIKAGVVGYQTEDLVYNANINAGQIYKIDVSQEAKKGRGIEKTKYKYPAGSWSNYEG